MGVVSVWSKREESKKYTDIAHVPTFKADNDNDDKALVIDILPRPESGALKWAKLTNFTFSAKLCMEEVSMAMQTRLFR